MRNFSNGLADLLVCPIVLFCLFVLGAPGVGMAGPLDAGNINIMDEAVRDWQWHQSTERPRTQAPQQKVPAPNQEPAVKPPDLSGLPSQLPGVTPAQQQPADEIPHPELTKPRLENSGEGQQGLIKPRIGGAPAHKASPSARQKMSETARGSASARSPQREIEPGSSSSRDSALNKELTRTKLEVPGQAKQTLIKPRIGRPVVQEHAATAPKVRERPARNESVQPQRSPVPATSRTIQDAPGTFAQPAPVPGQRQVPTPTRQVMQPRVQPEAASQHAGLIKPRLAGPLSRERPSARKSSAEPQRQKAAVAEPQMEAPPRRKQYPAPQQASLPPEVRQSVAPQPTVPSTPQPRYVQPYQPVSQQPLQQPPPPQQQMAQPMPPQPAPPQQQMAPPMQPQPAQPETLLRSQLSQGRYSLPDAEQSRRMWRMMGSWD